MPKQLKFTFFKTLDNSIDPDDIKPGNVFFVRGVNSPWAKRVVEKVSSGRIVISSRIQKEIVFQKIDGEWMLISDLAHGRTFSSIDYRWPKDDA